MKPNGVNALLRVVKRLKTIITIVLLALWVPLTSHSLLEHWEVIHLSAAGADAHDNDHDTADGICRIESFDSPLAKCESVELPFSFAPPFCASLDSVETQDGFEIRINSSPPDLAVCWQFISRTALPARAPSLS